VNDVLESWGFDTPNWSDQMPPGHESDAAVYMRDTDTIHINPDTLSGDARDAVKVALHEGMHATMDQLGWNDPNFQEEMLAAGAGRSVGQDLEDGCKDPTDSGDPSSVPDYPWVCGP
jgi:hypothetical protein